MTTRTWHPRSLGLGTPRSLGHRTPDPWDEVSQVPQNVVPRYPWDRAPPDQAPQDPQDGVPSDPWDGAAQDPWDMAPQDPWDGVPRYPWDKTPPNQTPQDPHDGASQHNRVQPTGPAALLAVHQGPAAHSGDLGTVTAPGPPWTDSVPPPWPHPPSPCLPALWPPWEGRQSKDAGREGDKGKEKVGEVGKEGRDGAGMGGLTGGGNKKQSRDQRGRCLERGGREGRSEPGKGERDGWEEAKAAAAACQTARDGHLQPSACPTGSGGLAPSWQGTGLAWYEAGMVQHG